MRRSISEASSFPFSTRARRSATRVRSLSIVVSLKGLLVASLFGFVLGLRRVGMGSRKITGRKRSRNGLFCMHFCSRSHRRRIWRFSRIV